MQRRKSILTRLLGVSKECYAETMPGKFLQLRSPWKGFLGLALLAFMASSCHRRPQAPAAPPPPNYLELGDEAYAAGDYPAAMAAYSAYLREHPDGPQSDHALLRLALSFALPSNPSRNPAKANAYLSRLSSQYPASPLRPEAELLAGLEQQIQQLQLDVQERQSQITRLKHELEQLNQQRSAELQEIQGDLRTREERIRQLSEELEKLKAIDMQRRPAVPPR